MKAPFDVGIFYIKAISSGINRLQHLKTGFTEYIVKRHMLLVTLGQCRTPAPHHQV